MPQTTKVWMNVRTLTMRLEEIYSEFGFENTDKTRLSEKMKVCFILWYLCSYKCSYKCGFPI